MKKKALVIFTMLAFSLLLTSVALAKPGAEKMNEDKFLSFEVSFETLAIPDFPNSRFNPGPPQDFYNTMVLFLTEYATACEITIDGTKTYTLGTDFTYEGTITMFINYNDNQEAASVKIDYSYIFDPASPNHDIDGTLEMRAIGKTWWDIEDNQYYDVTIRGQGTDDLAGVKVMAMGTGVNEIIHEGTVTNWP
jgi:hypothetical protein